MMCFNDCEMPYPWLEIVDNKKNLHAKDLTLKVHPLAIGIFSLVRKLLYTLIHLTEWSKTEMKDFMYNFSGKVRTKKVLLLKSSPFKTLLLLVLLAVMRTLAVGTSLLLVLARDFFIGLSSGFITLRHDDNLIVESYSPHQFSRQFGFCQDIPNVLIEHHYDAAITVSEAIDVAHKRKKPSSSSDKSVAKSLGVVPFCNNASKPPTSLHGGGITSVAFSSNENNVSQEQHWKHLKKKPKDLNN
ncbi:hypothetical protein HAX54_040310 [Datura stramonium]|uniref:Uncharacterized protein n=1 Tax=Datura stramonium TaxID=4076 RepID=A0ABS8VQK1_DATST|nr:hypothetical protein [Datura stramonium]